MLCRDSVGKKRREIERGGEVRLNLTRSAILTGRSSHTLDVTATEDIWDREGGGGYADGVCTYM